MTVLYVIKHSSITEDEFKTQFDEALQEIRDVYSDGRTAFEIKVHAEHMNKWDKAPEKVHFSTDFEMTSGEIEDIILQAAINTIPYSSVGERKLVLIGPRPDEELAFIKYMF